MPKLIKKSSEVFIAGEGLPVISREEIETLLSEARCNARQRSRLCLHGGPEEHLHEMVIVKTREAYVRPHQNIGKSKSFLSLEGRMGVALFTDAGAIDRLFVLGPLGAGLPCFLRISTPQYHTVVPLTDHIAFLETCTGPFRAGDTLYAAWAPTEEDEEKAKQFIEDLRSRLESVGIKKAG